jgi:hypothetical protein
VRDISVFYVDIDILRRLRDANTRKLPEKWRTDVWFLLHDNAPAHRSDLIKDFLVKYKVKTLEILHYSPDPAATIFYLFPRLKTTMKRRHFCDASDIIKNATEELKRLSQNCFDEC